MRVRPYLGTFVTIRAGGGSSDRVRRGIDDAFSRIARVHALMSVHDEASEISCLNRCAHRHAMAVSDDTFAVLTLASRMFSASGGVFDVTVGGRLARWGYVPQGESAPHRVTMGDVELLSGHRVRFARKLLVDLGGIAKGYAVDCAVDALREAGVPRGVVNAGGDLRVFGSGATVVHVRHPREPRRCVPLALLRDGALATSAVYFSRRRTQGTLVSAIVDPDDAEPCLKTSSASVVAPTCAIADALTKVVLVRERESASALREFEASAIILHSDGRIVTLEVDRAA